MSGRLELPILVTLLVAALLPAGVGAQVISGQLLEAETDRPIFFAEVAALDEDLKALATTISDGAGRFSLELPRSGRFWLYSERLGYFGYLSEGIDVRRLQVVEVAIRLLPAPVEVDSLSVKVDGRLPLLQRVGFYDRMNAGQGRFVTRIDIQEMIAVRAVADVIRQLPGVRIAMDQFGREHVLLITNLGGSCEPVLVLDGIAINPPWGRIVEVDNLDGIEVYSRPAQIPARFGSLTAPSRRRAGLSQCGIVVAWTRRR